MHANATNLAVVARGRATNGLLAFPGNAVWEVGGAVGVCGAVNGVSLDNTWIPKVR